MRNFVLAREAKRDLEEILDYIAEDSVEASFRVGERFEEVFEMLGNHPALGHFRRDLTARPLRFFPVYTYLVVYVDEGGQVNIARILSATRDLKRLLD
jgi:plasmid stabilization system protein ParE